MAEDRDHKSREHNSTPRSKQDDHAPSTSVAETPSLPSSLLGNSVFGARGNSSVQISLMTEIQQTQGNRAVQRMLKTSSPAPVAPSSNINRDVQRFLQRSAYGSARTQDHNGERSQTTSIQRQNKPSPDPAAEEAKAIEDCKLHAGGWMKAMLEKMSAMDVAHLQKMQEVNDAGKALGYVNTRLGAAIDAVLASKTSSALRPATLDWLAKNAEGYWDQVNDIRDKVGMGTFEPAFVKIVQTLGAAIKAKRTDYDAKMASTKVATDAQGADDPRADNENRRKLAESTYSQTKPLLNALKQITQGRAARYKCGDSAIEDAILATLELEIVFSAEATLSSPGNDREDAASAVGMDKSIEWCGAFVAKNYLQSELISKMVPGFPSTERLEAFFHYTQYIGTEPKWVFDQGEWKDLKAYHTSRSAERKWIGDADIFSKGKDGALDIRPGDVVLLDNNPNKRAEIEVPDPSNPEKKVKKTVKYADIPQGAKIIRVIEGEKGDHVQMVQSWNPATRELFVIEGNSDGYVVDNNPAHPDPAGESADQKKKRQEIEAATGKKLKTSTDPSHVAVGVSDLANQPDPSKLAASRKARVYGIGRLSIVDFETQTYDNSKEKPKNPPKGKK